jgi:hypothetical protein
MLEARYHGAVRLVGMTFQQEEEPLEIEACSRVSGQSHRLPGLTTFKTVWDLKRAWYCTVIRNYGPPERWPESRHREPEFHREDYVVYLDNQECRDMLELDRTWERPGCIMVLVRGDVQPVLPI